MHYDIVVMGSGMAGSISATVLAKYGYRVLLLEKSSHPRFALGESATLVTAKIFEYLTDFYQIPEFGPLITYEGAVSLDPPMQCGPKEYFHFYLHKMGEKDSLVNGRHPELASQIPFVVNQYFREDFDERLVAIAEKYGVDYVDRTEVTDLDIRNDGISLTAKSAGDSWQIEASYLLDATGHNSFLSRKLDLRDQNIDKNTPLRSRSIFTHLRGVKPFEEVMGGADFNPNINIDRRLATQHHCFDGGWYWFIPFDNGITSVGLSLDMDRFPMNEKDGETEFWEITRKLPRVEAMLADIEPVMPYIKTQRLQFYNRRISGDRWVQLPAAAMGLDAWQSSGLAVSLMAVHRIAEILHHKVFPCRDFHRDHMMIYENALRKEYRALSDMVHGMYKSFRHFDVFALFSMIPFIGTFGFLNNDEHKRPLDENALIMHFGDPKFRADFDKVYRKVLVLSEQESVRPEDLEYIRKIMLEDMADNNPRRYGDPRSKGLYANVENELMVTAERAV